MPFTGRDHGNGIARHDAAVTDSVVAWLAENEALTDEDVA
jgi:hypothetical protein